MSSMRISRNNGIILITGGSRGIGKAIAEKFADQGNDLIIAGRDAESLNLIQKEISTSWAKIHIFRTDLSNPEERKVFIKSVQEKFTRIDVLVNNVGTNIRKKAEEYSEDEVSFLLQTNLLSAFDLSRSFYNQLLNSDYPSIINISSVAGLGHLRTGVVYGMTKAALNQMTKNLAAEWAADGIRVNAVVPWYIETPLARQVLSDKDYLDDVIKRTPMGRIGKPEEVASVVRFLASKDASYITGQSVAVDGGFSINLF